MSRETRRRLALTPGPSPAAAGEGSRIEPRFVVLDSCFSCSLGSRFWVLGSLVPLFLCSFVLREPTARSAAAPPPAPPASARTGPAESRRGPASASDDAAPTARARERPPSAA